MTDATNRLEPEPELIQTKPTPTSTSTLAAICGHTGSAIFHSSRASTHAHVAYGGGAVQTFETIAYATEAGKLLEKLGEANAAEADSKLAGTSSTAPVCDPVHKPSGRRLPSHVPFTAAAAAATTDTPRRSIRNVGAPGGPR